MQTDWLAMTINFRIIVISAGLLCLLAVSSFIFLVLILRKKADISDIPDDKLTVDVAYFREIGMRRKQEDSYYISPLEDYGQYGTVACVSDGIGGLKYGAQISDYVVSQVGRLWPISFHASEHTAECIRRISDSVFEMYKMKGGATIAMIHICNGYMHFYSVGDSQIILIRDGEATILNQKQNYASVAVKEQMRIGKSTQSIYENLKTKALTDFVGNYSTRVLFSNRPMRVMDGDTVVVCSDGVTDSVPLSTIAKYCSKHSAQNTASNIKMSVRLHKNPRQDNFTGVVVKLSRGLV